MPKLGEYCDSKQKECKGQKWGGIVFFAFTVRAALRSAHITLQQTLIGTADRIPKNAVSDRLQSIPSSYNLWSDFLLVSHCHQRYGTIQQGLVVSSFTR